MGTGCAPLVAGLFLFCCRGDFVMSLSDGRRASVVDAFGVKSRCLDDILNISSIYFDSVVSQVCLSGLQLNKAKFL